ncbi:extracellular solute-binding protein [Albimonas sp. CAU 1670]|uniref:extracellular solute-binding protein n=1 Tax=Albimonas sp. CAU 1670 TaxID=3032599 RepID=UPI0023DA2555|nr:extracellular solute-binding protein [Albimonas sp. CAU 1670]MDF2232337.1 extracellular solute-binding protein [Albimonas sp. CAU 1670]
MLGEPALPADFDHLPYANPDAPKGGRIVLGEIGGFDSLNPYILKGRSVWAVRGLMIESLMMRSIDEPFTLYPSLAASVTVPEDRAWVEFTLDPRARFSDGTPVTVEDVIWSMEVLAEKGLPAFGSTWKQVAKVERTGELSVRFDFVEPDPELPLILALRPILQKAHYEGRDFAESSLEPPIASGPYLIEEVDPSRRVTFRKDPDWWGADLPVNRGRFNFDVIRHEWFKDGSALFEAFRAGDIDLVRDGDPARWEDGYAFPAAQRGEVVQETIPSGRPSGMTGFVFNTRRDLFKDMRVREALGLAFDFEWVNQTLNRGAFARVRSPFGGSALGFEGPAEGREREILAPFAADLPDGALDEGFAWPQTDGSGRSRRNLRAATKLLAEAGWSVKDGVLVDGAGRPFRFEILLGGPAWETAAEVFARQLKPLGIEASVRLVDGAQYEARRSDYDFDMIVNTWAMSLSPGAEQRFYWGRAGVTQGGTRNYPGIDSPAVEAAIDALLAAATLEDQRAAVRALDRVLTVGRWFVPLWYAPESRIAYRADLHHPERLPLYGDWPGWLPDVWWRE